MADVTLWQSKEARAAFQSKAKVRLAELRPELAAHTGMIAVEPESGDYFFGPTLGKANDAAFAKYPDKWVYFARLDDLDAAIMLPTW